MDNATERLGILMEIETNFLEQNVFGMKRDGDVGIDDRRGSGLLYVASTHEADSLTQVRLLEDFLFSDHLEPMYEQPEVIDDLLTYEMRVAQIVRETKLFPVQTNLKKFRVLYGKFFVSARNTPMFILQPPEKARHLAIAWPWEAVLHQPGGLFPEQWSANLAVEHFFRRAGIDHAVIPLGAHLERDAYGRPEKLAVDSGRQERMRDLGRELYREREELFPFDD